ncbi:conserved unknown protein [Ectocarpus siliculosus]|uniref:SET domain-containing protein n=1 Tax=Ectocarpus siliculosus TaxID=2880 RepID=D7G932_ECTSI|nr:conserved unknown protein [Ectocarpus siliculosus]|eukprot:CBJ28193.1 conserved unknown protein [Ectocarpus siliculosus]
MFNTRTGRLSFAFWGESSSVYAAVAGRQVAGSSFPPSGTSQRQKSGARRGSGSEADRRHRARITRGLKDGGITLRERPPTENGRYVEAMTQVVALHSAVLGEDFLPFSSGGEPMEGGPHSPLGRDKMLRVSTVLRMARDTRESSNDETADSRFSRMADNGFKLCGIYVTGVYLASRLCLRMGKSEVQGHGVFADEAIPADTLISDFYGEGIDSAEAQQRADHYRDVGFYRSIVKVGGDPGEDPLYVDVMRHGYPARFFNHSCEPNAYLQTMVCQKGDLMYKIVWFCTSRDTAEGEEVCFSYPALHSQSSDKEEPDCNCRSPSCRGKMFQR